MPRNKEPIDLVIAKGKKNLTKAEIEKRRKEEIKAGNTKVKPPSYLPNDLKKEFRRIAKLLIEIGIMTDLDNEALARFIVSEHQYQMMTEKILSMKYVTDKYLEYTKLQDKFFKQSRAAASDLGLTISSRCKLVIPKAKQEENIKQTEGQKRFAGRL